MTGRPPTVLRPTPCSLARQARVASTWQERHHEDNRSRVWAFRGKSARFRRRWQCLQVFMGGGISFAAEADKSLAVGWGKGDFSNGGGYRGGRRRPRVPVAAHGARQRLFFLLEGPMGGK